MAQSDPFLEPLFGTLTLAIPECGRTQRRRAALTITTRALSRADLLSKILVSAAGFCSIGLQG